MDKNQDAKIRPVHTKKDNYKKNITVTVLASTSTHIVLITSWSFVIWTFKY